MFHTTAPRILPPSARGGRISERCAARVTILRRTWAASTRKLGRARPHVPKGIHTRSVGALGLVRGGFTFGRLVLARRLFVESLRQPAREIAEYRVEVGIARGADDG